MAAKPKLSPEQWAAVKDSWERDEREGYAWLIVELELPVSGPAIRKVAIRDGWTKNKNKKTSKPAKKQAEKAQKPIAKNKVSKVSENHEGMVSMVSMVSETIDEDGAEDESKVELGRPTLYRKEYAEQAYRLCLLGLTDEELAVAFKVCEKTINNWKIEYPDFLQSIERGKLTADAEVAESTFKSATGKHFIEQDSVTNDGSVVTLRKQIPPDVSAQRLWLLNRRPKQWKNKVEVKEDINLNIFPPKEVLDGIYEKALADAAKRREMLAERRMKINALIAQEGGDITDV